VHAKLKPKKVAEINDEEQGERGEEYAASDVAERRRGIGESAW